MSSTTKTHTVIMAHVPVDYFDIVNGPRHNQWLEAALELLGAGVRRYEYQEQHGTYPELLGEVVEFTLQTIASEQRFTRKLKIMSINKMFGSDYSFEAIFNGQAVSGSYDTNKHTGHFQLD